MSEAFKITTKPQKGDDGYRTFSVRIKEETVAELERIAGVTGRSRNEVVGLMLEYAIQHCEILPEG